MKWGIAELQTIAMYDKRRFITGLFRDVNIQRLRLITVIYSSGSV